MGEIVFPAAGYIAIAVEATRQITESTEFSLKNIHLKNGLLLQPTSDVELLTSFRPVRLTNSIDSIWFEFTICSYNGGRWTKHCVGQTRPGADHQPPTKTIHPSTRTVSSDQWYEQIKEYGLDYGPRFRMLKDITASPLDRLATAAIIDDPEIYESQYAVHPTVIDQCLQLLGVAVCQGMTHEIDQMAIPLFIERIYITSGTPSMSLEATVSDPSSNEMNGNAILIADDHVAVFMELATFFTLDDPNFQTGYQIPIVSHAEWRPSIHFLPLSNLLHSAVDTGPISDFARLSLLSVIEASHKLRPYHSDEPHLIKHKKWVESEVVRIREDAYSFIPEAQGWASLDTDTRSKIYNDILEAGGYTQTYPQHDAIRKAIEVYDEIYAGNTANFLEYMMEGDKLKDLYEFGASQVDWKGLLSSLGHSNPQIRILEVGAGTCATTLKVLACLKSPNGTPLFSRYAVTDISPGFLQSAKSTLADEANIEYHTLDISQDPVSQGFESESFDLIIASNVGLHCLHPRHLTIAHFKHDRSCM